MPSDADALLAVGLVAVYLIDSMHFLSIGDAIVTTRGGRPFGLSFGSPFELAGRRLYLSNPLTPFRPDFRVEWDTAGAPVSAPAEVARTFTRHLQAVRALGPLMGACAMLVVLVAPLSLAMGFQIVFLGAVALCLLLTIAACVVVILRRADLGLSAGQTAGAVFVALVCLPCSPNLVRAVSRRRQWCLNARDLPQLGFEPSSGPQLRARVRDALVNAQRFVTEDGKEHNVIAEQLRALVEPAP